MSVAKVRLLAALVVFLGVSERAWPQISNRELHGQITVDAGQLLLGYTASLFDLSSRMEVDRADIDGAGYFTLHGAESGNYMVRIRDGNNVLVREAFANSSGRNVPMLINVVPRHASKPAGGIISVNQLQHPPSDKAVQAFFTARQFSEAGQYSRAAGELEKAVRISPEFAEAYTNLAVQYVRMGRFQDAAGASRRAMAIGSPNPRDLSNLAVALWALNRLPEALEAGEKALNLDSGFIEAHFVVGSLLVANPATRAEGIQHLKIAAQKMPVAARNLERVLQAYTRDGR